MRRMLLCAILSLRVFGQQAITHSPDCLLRFNLAATGNSANLDNRMVGCSTWTVSYSAYNASAVTLTMQSAPDAGNTPGTFAGFGSGLTSTTYASTSQTGYVPWLNVTGTFTFTAGGFVRGSVVGWRP